MSRRNIRTRSIQTLSYLKASGCEVGLLLNFGAKSLEIRRPINTTDRDCGANLIVRVINPISDSVVQRNRCAAREVCGAFDFIEKGARCAMADFAILAWGAFARTCVDGLQCYAW
jgi:hypothetical protein